LARYKSAAVSKSVHKTVQVVVDDSPAIAAAVGSITAASVSQNKLFYLKIVEI